jgi:hypothetical protein
VVLGGCGEPVAERPSRGTAPPEPLRVVSLSVQATRVVQELGQGARLVAVDEASARLPGLEALPLTDGETLGRFDPDIVLAPTSELAAAHRAAPHAEWMEVDVHDFDDGWALCHAIGALLGRTEEARRFVQRRSRPLAEIAAESFGKRRPRVVAVLRLDPLEVAGGHSFATDLIEMAGGESVTHGSEAPRLEWTAARLAAAAPELVVLVGPRAGTKDSRRELRRRLGPGPPIEILPLDLEQVWLSEGARAARMLRRWIAPISRSASRVGRGAPGGLAGSLEVLTLSRTGGDRLRRVVEGGRCVSRRLRPS